MRQAKSKRATAEALRRAGRFACLDFVNSAWTDWSGDGEAADRLGSPEWWSAFLTRWGLEGHGLTAPTGGRLNDLRALRRMMRNAIEKGRMPKGADLDWMNTRLAASPQRWTISNGKPGVVATRTGWPSVIALLILSFGQLFGQTDLSRLKKCANPDCSYVFYDVSTNRSRRWCFSNVCGNLIHVRDYRSRVMSIQP